MESSPPIPRSRPVPAAVDPIAVRLGRRFRANAAGEVALEYGLVAALIVVALIAALPVLNGASVDMFNRIRNAIVAAP